jgi:basic amino acid/polyamine antiporter, APA family
VLVMNSGLQSRWENEQPHLTRGLGLGGTVAVCMIDMIGVGPFITIPLMLALVPGPHALVGWILGALLAICDCLVWAELGAAMPRAGGSYEFLKEIYGRERFGRLFAFLFVFQLSFSAPLSIASGAIGLGGYAKYIWPQLSRPLFGTITGGTLLAMGCIALAVVLLYRRITAIGWISKLMLGGVLGTMAWVIIAGFTHFSAAQAFTLPADAFHFSREFFLGFGGAMLIATYDYWGYYNACFLGAEVSEPERNIPRAMITSILVVAVLYLVMNISILGVLPWQELVGAAKDESRFFVISTMMERIHGGTGGVIAAVLIMWTAFASIFSLLLGYSRVPYAAALDGNYFRIFARVHPKLNFPYISLLFLGAMAAAFTMFTLASVVTALVVIRITLQFLLQAIGVIALRRQRPEMPRPFRMWLYPLPALIATVGFVFVLISRTGSLRQLGYAALIAVIGTAIFIGRAAARREWPFAAAASQRPV